MKKYLFIFKSEIMSNLQYMSNIVFGFVGCFIMLFIFLNLWTYIYSDPSELINGYSMNQMIWYVIITELLWMCISGRKLCRKICDDVRGGNIAYNINKPYSYIGYSLFNHLGSTFVRGIIYMLLCILTGFFFLGSFPVLTLASVIIVIISLVFAIVISVLLIVAIGLVSFFIEDANPLYWLYSKFILVLGVIFPIEYFPSFMQPFLVFSPIYVVSYGPAKLFVDFSWEVAANVLLMQGVYIGLAYLLCSLIYKKGVRNLNVNGG